VFTYHEKQRMGLSSGTKKKRLAGDSLKQFGTCGLCLSPLIGTVSCKKGHLFCKECICKQLLVQKRQQKQQLAKYLEQEEQEQRKKKETDQKDMEEIKKQFERTNNGLLPVEKSGSSSSSKVVPDGFAAITTNDGEVIYASDKQRQNLEKGMSRRLATENSDGFAKRDSLKNAFWIPQNIPTAEEGPIKKPDGKCKCPEGCSSLSMKQLIPVKFKEDTSGGSRKLICPSCSRELNNALKSVLFSQCGHVICVVCEETLVRKDGVCPVCSKRVREKDVIHLQAGGTGFAAHNDNLVAKKTGAAMRV